jgi:hypothetical protein
MTTPFYEKARNLFLRTQDAQIQKGLLKYPEPFNPMSWTPQELLNHALEESVDLVHYLVGLKEQLDKKDDEITILKHKLRGQVKLNQQYYLELRKLNPKKVRNLAEEGIQPGPVAKYFDADDQ